jgi:hypothetical protein
MNIGMLKKDQLSDTRALIRVSHQPYGIYFADHRREQVINDIYRM